MKRYEIRKFVRLGILWAVIAAHGQAVAVPNASSSIPWSQLGAKAGADYSGDGLAVTQTESGVSLHCVFQRLDGEATSAGLRLTSTVTSTGSDRFRVTAIAVGRKTTNTNCNPEWAESSVQLTRTGDVSIEGQTARFVRPGLTEEYSVSMDGVRQDFIVGQAPSSPPAGELVVTLEVAGAKVEPAPYGARLALENSGRKIAYSRLRVTDATGKVLPARIELRPAREKAASVAPCSESGDFFESISLLTPAAPEATLAVLVDDASAVYPVRIDPTFSDANWVSMGGEGANDAVYAAVVDASGDLYIGGQFTAVGNINVNAIGKWDGTSWSALGGGILGAGATQPNPIVWSLAVSGSNVYAGGDFMTVDGDTNASFVVQWDGASWSALGPGLNGDVYALAVSGATLYAAGEFNYTGDYSVGLNYIAQWNGHAWSALDTGMNFGAVAALAVSGSTLYAGGAFTTAGGAAAQHIAQWNGAKWSALGAGINGYVSALALSGGTLYAGGSFTASGTIAATNIAQWNGSGWSALGMGVGLATSGGVSALAVSGGTLYAGGEFSTAGGVPAQDIAQWNGINWSPLGSGVGGEVSALAVFGHALYVGGGFFLYVNGGSTSDGNVAQWDGTNWLAMGSGLNLNVLALAVSGSTLYAGGDFTTAGGDTNANYIAQWNGSAWSPLGLGMGGEAESTYVNALAVSGSTLYAGGNFTTAGGTAANYIAQWNGTNWSALGSGMDSYVSALAVSGSTLYAGGDFTTAGGDTNANYIAQWNGSSWSSLGAGMDTDVNALAISGATLYAGGDFFTAGGIGANYIAQWDGSNWSALDVGLTGHYLPGVSALAVSGSTLYAGGYFTNAGGVPANYIAQWNGSSWSALTSGVNDEVTALAASSSTLYAGGVFTAAGGIPANYIAQWDGTNWSAAGSGMNSIVYALTVSDSTLYAGGDFTTAGTNVSFYAAEAILDVAPPNYTISVSASPSSEGSASGSGTFPSGSSQTVTASANSGCAFVDWAENGTVVSSLANYTFTLNSNVALVANFTTPQTNTFCTEIQTTSSSSLSYDSGLFTYTDSDASDTSEEHAILPLCGAAASAITSTNAWTASISVNLSARTFTAATSHAELGLVVSTNLSGPLSSTGFIFELAQENNTGNGDGGSTDIYPDGWYGTALSFQALLNGARDPATPLGASQATANGSIYLLLSGGTTNAGSTESIDSASGILTITYDPSHETVIGTYNGTDVASYSLAGWGPNPPLALGVWSGSGKLLSVPSGTATANNFSVNAVESGPAFLSIATNSGAISFTNGVFDFSISGPAGSNVVIQASVDLKTWIPLQTNLLGAGPLYFSDMPTNQLRFYRVVLP